MMSLINSVTLCKHHAYCECWVRDSSSDTSEVHDCLQDDEDAWRDNPFDCEAVPVQTETDNLQFTSLALLDEKIQAYQKERTKGCDSSQHDCR